MLVDVSGLVTEDYERLLAFAASVLDSFDGTSLWPSLATELVDTLPGHLVGMVDVRAGGGIVRQLLWPTWAEGLDWDEAAVAAHPLVRHYQCFHDPFPRTVNEVADPHEWINSAVYSRARTDLRGATRQLAIPVSGPDGIFRSVVIGRSGTDFDARERQLALRLQPLLERLSRHLHTAVAWRSDAPPTAVESAKAIGLTAREVTVLALLAEGLTAPLPGRDNPTRALRSPRITCRHRSWRGRPGCAGRPAQPGHPPPLASRLQMEGIVAQTTTRVLRFHIHAVGTAVSARGEHLPRVVDELVGRIPDRRHVRACGHVPVETDLEPADPQMGEPDNARAPHVVAAVIRHHPLSRRRRRLRGAARPGDCHGPGGHEPEQPADSLPQIR
ncbi:hypothetical protein [Krasilnikovia sp. MM14-A1004]|uniref:hypothetical protein n=1 Tax=Krasilnikovia sp. MM14-A1004 TaxID=3373541 RepID=UPI00399C7B01